MAVYFSFLKHGDVVLGMDLSHGGHLTHGSSVNFSGKFYNFVSYGVDRESGLIDYNIAVSYTHLRAHETVLDIVCRLLLEKKKR